MLLMRAAGPYLSTAYEIKLVSTSICEDVSGNSACILHKILNESVEYLNYCKSLPDRTNPPPTLH